MSASDGQDRFYGELAEWWPLISPVADYADEAPEIEGHLRSATRPVHEVLELGSGGGHVAFWLKPSFDLTLVDLSPAMLAGSTTLNPECDHVAGDMRTVRLGRTFDAVLIHDAVDYLTTEADLLAAFRTAFAHCRPGGIMVVLPDHTRDDFEPSSDHGGSDGTDGRGVRYLEWTTDPDQDDTVVRTDYVFLLRDEGGRVRAVPDAHETGLFDRATWLRLIGEAGFRAEARPEQTDDDRPPRTVFVGWRPT